MPRTYSVITTGALNGLPHRGESRQRVCSIKVFLPLPHVRRASHHPPFSGFSEHAAPEPVALVAVSPMTDHVLRHRRLGEHSPWPPHLSLRRPVADAQDNRRLLNRRAALLVLRSPQATSHANRQRWGSPSRRPCRR